MLDCDIADGLVVQAEVRTGFLHRGAEKLFEVRDYRQLLMLADRHDWQSAFTGELGAALACEAMLGLAAPPRAVWLRTLLAELARMASHLAFLSFVPHRLADLSAANAVRASREAFRGQLLALTGNRVHPMVNRLGGLSVDADAAWLASVGVWAEDVANLADRLQKLLETPRWREISTTGALSPSQIGSFGLSGPIARSAGLERDLRRAPGYLNYPLLDFGQPPSKGEARDSSACGRISELVEDLSVSRVLVDQCIEALAHVGGPVSTDLAKIIKLPEGTGHYSLEAPWGVAGWHIVSRGERTPWRVKLRTPTWANMSALGAALAGTPVDHVDVVVASLGYTIGDLDK